MEQIEDNVLSWINNLQPHEWLVLMAAVIVVGALSMKGITSRS